MKHRVPLSGLLAGVLLLTSCATPRTSAQLEAARQALRPGISTRAEVQARLGPPDENIEEEEARVWVYSAQFSLPMGVGYLPVLGDLLDLAETAHNLSNAHELIIQFDEQGVVRKRSLRALP